MTTLSITATNELELTLSGVQENRILATVRRWPYWQRVAIERDPADGERCLAVTLIADRVYESTVREILRRSFGMRFPAEGGSCDIGPEPPPSSRWRGRSSPAR